MRAIFSLFITAALLTGCAYALDKQYQDITVLTPGAEGAECFVIVDDVKFKLRPPQTASIFKSDEDLVVDCRAPGNRRNKVVIKPAYSEHAQLNVLNAGIGMAWDHESGALYKYPDIVEVSFIDTPFRPQALPAQNKPDIKQPEEYPLEEFSPGQPRLNSDRYTPPVKVKRRRAPSSSNAASKAAFSESVAVETVSKGELHDVVKSYGSAIDPSGHNAPTPLVPGE